MEYGKILNWNFFPSTIIDIYLYISKCYTKIYKITELIQNKDKNI